MPPGFRVSINGEEVVTVSTEGLNVLNVGVSGIRTRPEFAWLEVTGGWYGEGVENKHYLWEADRQLNPGDEITVSFLQVATSSRPGKTIDELYEGEVENFGPGKSMDKVFEERAQEPFVRDGYAFTVSTTESDPIKASTASTDWSFGFTVIWNWLHPERANTWLSSNSLEKIAKREIGYTHFRKHVALGEHLSLVLGST